MSSVMTGGRAGVMFVRTAASFIKIHGHVCLYRSSTVYYQVSDDQCLPSDFDINGSQQDEGDLPKEITETGIDVSSVANAGGVQLDPSSKEFVPHVKQRHGIFTSHAIGSPNLNPRAEDFVPQANKRHGIFQTRLTPSPNLIASHDKQIHDIFISHPMQPQNLTDGKDPVLFSKEVVTDGKDPVLLCTYYAKVSDLKYARPYRLPEMCPLPPLTDLHIRVLSETLSSVPGLVGLCSFGSSNRVSFLIDLEAFIRTHYDDANLTLFGSSCNGFGFEKSDMDICLTFSQWKVNDKKWFIESLAEKMKQSKDLVDVEAISTAKVPIVKFVVKSLDLECDISLYNILAQHNTRLLFCYSQIDPRVQILGYAIKYFANVCDIGDASRGSLSSYAYLLMMIYYLQQVSPPVVPVLQELYESKEKPQVIAEECDVWFMDDLEKLNTLWSDKGKNKMSVAELWVGFLRFYVEEFNCKEIVVSIRQKEPVTRLDKLWNGENIAIEDPFKHSHNLGSGLTRKMNNFIFKTFSNGRMLHGSPIENNMELFKKYDNPFDYFFDPELLSESRPPNVRGCHFCGKMGHLLRQCAARKAQDEQNIQQQPFHQPQQLQPQQKPEVLAQEQQESYPLMPQHDNQRQSGKSSQLQLKQQVSLAQSVQQEKPAFSYANDLSPELAPPFNYAHNSPQELAPAFNYAHNSPQELAPAFNYANNSPTELSPAFSYANNLPQELAPAFNYANNLSPELAPAFNYATNSPTELSPAFSCANNLPQELAPAFNYANNLSPELAPAFNYATNSPTELSPAFSCANNLPQELAPAFNYANNQAHQAAVPVMHLQVFHNTNYMQHCHHLHQNQHQMRGYSQNNLVLLAPGTVAQAHMLPQHGNFNVFGTGQLLANPHVMLQPGYAQPLQASHDPGSIYLTNSSHNHGHGFPPQASHSPGDGYPTQASHNSCYGYPAQVSHDPGSVYTTHASHTQGNEYLYYNIYNKHQGSSNCCWHATQPWGQ